MPRYPISHIPSHHPLSYLSHTLAITHLPLGIVLAIYTRYTNQQSPYSACSFLIRKVYMVAEIMAARTDGGSVCVCFQAINQR
jgi:hypothetical protein